MITNDVNDYINLLVRIVSISRVVRTLWCGVQVMISISSLLGMVGAKQLRQKHMTVSEIK